MISAQFELLPPTTDAAGKASWLLQLKGSTLEPSLSQFLKPVGLGRYQFELATSAKLLGELIVKNRLQWQGKPLHADLFSKMQLVHELSCQNLTWLLRAHLQVGATRFYLDQALVCPAGRWLIYRHFLYRLSDDIDRRALLIEPRQVDSEQARSWMAETASYSGLAELLLDASCRLLPSNDLTFTPQLRLSDLTLCRATLTVRSSTGQLAAPRAPHYQSFARDLEELGASNQQPLFSWLHPHTAHTAIETLLEIGWLIEGPHGEPLRRIESIEWSQAEESSEGFTASGEAKLSAVPGQLSGSMPLGPLAHHLRRGVKLAPLEAGALLLLPSKLDSSLMALKTAQPKGTHLHWQRWQATLALQATSKQLPDSWHAWRELLELRDGEKIAPAVNGLPVELRAYQQQAVGWLRQLYRMKLGGLLADEMGLGKTIQLLAFLRELSCNFSDAAREGACDLVVVPRSLLPQWQWQIERFLGTQSCHLYHGSQRQLLPLDHKDRVWLTTYQTLILDSEALGLRPWRVTIFDESHLIRNPKSQGFAAACALKSQMKIACSGTPIFNCLEDLWSQMELVAPHFVAGAERSELLSLAAPLWLRRSKKEVACELPPKNEQLIWLEMDLPQRQLYERILASEMKLQGPDPSKLQILEKILRLRQCCLLPELIEPGWPETGVKQEQLLQDLAILLSEDRSILIFSQFSQVLAPCYQAACTAGYCCHYLDAKTAGREAVLSAFQQGPPSALFMTLGTGAVGLNLTRASAVILLDPWWNEAVENQAIDRAHRIGQERGIDVIRYLVKGTLEEAMVELKTQKARHTDSWISSSEAPSSFDLELWRHLKGSKS